MILYPKVKNLYKKFIQFLGVSSRAVGKGEVSVRRRGEGKGLFAGEEEDSCFPNYLR